MVIELGSGARPATASTTAATKTTTTSNTTAHSVTVRSPISKEPSAAATTTMMIPAPLNHDLGANGLAELDTLTHERLERLRDGGRVGVVLEDLEDAQARGVAADG